MQLLHILETAINAILPIILLILFGYWLRRIDFLTDEFSKVGNKFVFNVGLFCSMFINVYSIGGLSSIRWDFVIYILVVILVLFAVGLLLAIASTKVASRRGVILQGVFRSNFAILGLSLASALGGPEAESVAAVASAFAIPLFNVFGVIAMTVFSDEKEAGKHRIKGALVSIIKNPMILGALLGAACLALRELQIAYFGEVIISVKDNVPFLYSAISSLKSITTPLALVVLGAQFKFSAVKGLFREIVVSTLGRILVAPIIGIGIAILLSEYTQLLNFSVNEYAVLVGLFGSPTAISGAVVAAQMGGDEQLATQTVVWTSLGSMLTVFLIVCSLMAMGYLPV